MLFSVEEKTPDEIELELNQAEIQFTRAEQMFNPWYTGPLITPSASMMPPGSANIQPYLFYTDNYAQFNSNRKSVSFESNLQQLNPQFIIQTGITNTTDLAVGFSGVANWQNGQSGGGFNDITATIGFSILRESRYVPKIKFTIQETFPTGNYQNLNTNGLGLSATGQGAFQTQFGLSLGKLFFWTTSHPLNTRLFFGYKTPNDSVEVHNFNAYGGGYGTYGHVRIGNAFKADLGLELSLTERWVAAIDIVYTAQGKTSFYGFRGVSSEGAPASVGSGYSDNLSLAPAFEYNWNENLGIVAGGWFSVYGRNSLNFGSAVFSVT